MPKKTGIITKKHSDFLKGNDIMFELRQLKQLIALSEYGTLSEAAEKLFITQPALSRSM